VSHDLFYALAQSRILDFHAKVLLSWADID